MGGQSRRKRGCKSTSVALAAIFGTLISVATVHATSLQDWLFNTSSQPTVTYSDPNLFVFGSDSLQLKVLDQTDSASYQFSQSALTAANFDNTAVDSYGLRVSSALTLPDFAVPGGWTDMTGNALLLHMDDAPQISVAANTITLKDSSGQSKSPMCTPIATGCPQVAADGKLGTAAWFNGTNNFLKVPGTWGTGWDAATIEAWVRVDGVTTTGDTMQAIVSSIASGLFIHFQMVSTGDAFNAAVYGSAGYAIASYDPTKPKLALKTWHHLAVTTAPGSTIIYADGQPVGSSSVNIGTINGTSDLRIGNGYTNSRFFKGSIDEVAIYQRALSADEIKAHYDRQTRPDVGMMTSRLFSAGTPNAIWDTLSWIPLGPNGVQLPNKASVESAYVSGNANMTGNVLLMHLNDAAGLSTFKDDSGMNNTGTCVPPNCPTLGQVGEFATAAYFYDKNIPSSITVPSSVSLEVTDAITLEAWVYPTGIPWTGGSAFGVISKGSYDGSPYWQSDYGLYLGSEPTYATAGTNVAAYFGMVGHCYNPTTLLPAACTDLNATPGVLAGNLPLNAWTHVVGTYDSTTSLYNLYINGVRIASQAVSGGKIVASAKPLMVGQRHVYATNTQTGHFKGKIDEVAVYNRAIASDEVRSRYLRGAMQPKFQVRSCKQSNCSDGIFMGPGKSVATYYGVPPLATGSGSTQTTSIAVDPNAYFQYKVILNSQSSTYFPGLQSVKIGPDHYPTTVPSAVMAGMDYYELTNFLESSLVAGLGEVRYQLSPDSGVTWYHFDSSAWVKNSAMSLGSPALDAQLNANLPSSVGANISSFPKPGKLAVKVLFLSDGSQPVSVKKVSVGFTPPPVCGNGVKEVTEGCDEGSDKNSDTGTCTTKCALPTCGDGFVQAGETCDGSVPVGTTCQTVAGGFSSGELACVNCALDKSKCKLPDPVCGNGKLESGEECDDGNKVDGDVCTNGCKIAVCGDGIRKIEGEVCDGADLGDASCASQPGGLYVGGPLSCSANCQMLDVSQCIVKTPKCGDGVIDPNEECDDGNAENTDSCTSACTLPQCGDGIVQSGEVCDTSNLNGKDCVAQGFVGGPLTCNADCKALVTTACYQKTVKFSDVPKATVAEGGSLSLTFSVSPTLMPPPYNFTCQANCPKGMEIDSSTGEITWTPGYDQSGIYSNISFKVTNNVGQDATQKISIEVKNTDMPPQIKAIEDKVTTAGQALVFTVSATPPDGVTPAYKIMSGLQDGMVLDATSGEFLWTPTTDQAGAYIVVFRAMNIQKPLTYSDQAVAMSVVADKFDFSSVAAGNLPESANPETVGALSTESKGTAPGQSAENAEPATASGCALVR